MVPTLLLRGMKPAARGEHFPGRGRGSVGQKGSDRLRGWDRVGRVQPERCILTPSVVKHISTWDHLFRDGLDGPGGDEIGVDALRPETPG